MKFPRRCYACNAALEGLGPERPTTYQFDNALWITLDGGYGMFVESDSFFLYSDFWATLSVEVRKALHQEIVDEYTAKHPEYKPQDDYPVDIDTPIMGALTPELTLQFRDYVEEHREHKVVICHDCAHEMCEKLPWMKRLIKPHSSHSHRLSWKEAHPDHWGWDYDADKERT